ncbi:MAG: glmZ(sRNA)-inactivating NTPase [Tenericutes bacterium ADurb.BinA155]|nr:MAG: glmZ(sRNA)-inactivating NTPase [Tenericutes bacterium ADurb.BinA155]
MERVRPLADLYIDTTGLQSSDLRKTVFSALDSESGTRMAVIFASFGYKYGIPQDAEIVLDTRIVPNPFWVKGLKTLTGLDQPVIDFLDAQPECPELFQKMCDYLDFYLPRLQKEGRSFVFVDIGCSGGQHRSVYFAEKLYQRYKKTYLCSINHRELPRYTSK